MSAQPNYSRFPGMGDLPGDKTNPNSPDYVHRESILDCPNETGTWLDEHMAPEILAGATEIIGDYLTSDQDIYARNKLQRQMVELAQRCEDAIRKAEGDAS